MKASRQGRVPPIVARYFGTRVEHPIVTAEFHPDTGWRTQSYRKRITVAWARKPHRAGATHIQLASGGRRADFSIREILRP
jgi:hypothetical protein